MSKDIDVRTELYESVLKGWRTRSKPKKMGNSEEDMLEELEAVEKGESWCHFSKVK